MEALYNQFSDRYNNLFIENIKAFKAAVKDTDKNYCCFYPSFGIRRNENCDFLIYGQATKGWQPEFNCNSDIDYEDFLKKSIECSNAFYKEKSHCPLDWVNVRWSPGSYNQSDKKVREFYNDFGEYYANKSFFWNVTYKLICCYYNINQNSHEWSKKMIWSNLYKIAPADRKNPTNEACEWQEEKSVELVKKEIEEISPLYCIVLTNDDWWQPFREKIGTKKVTGFKRNEYIHSCEQYLNTKIIVTKRPFNGASDNYVKEILKWLEKNS